MESDISRASVKQPGHRLENSHLSFVTVFIRKRHKYRRLAYGRDAIDSRAIAYVNELAAYSEFSQLNAEIFTNFQARVGSGNVNMEYID